MNKRLAAALIAAACAAVPAMAKQMDDQDHPQAEAHKLGVGDKAPPLTDVTWIQGDKVSEFKSGEVYVLDFWATWCGPCVASIPHINEMHNEYKDKGVNIIGVAIWPNARMTPTKDFVEAKGDDMAYRIAADVDGKTAKAYMEAAGQNGIPTAMVIDQAGKIAWIGHPMDGLDEVVELVHQNKFDAKAFEAHQKELEAKAAPIMQELQTAYMAEDWGKVASACEKLMSLDAKKFGTMSMLRYQAMTKAGDAKASDYGRELVRGQYAKDAQALNAIAWGIVDPEAGVPTSEQDLDLALEAAEQANELTKHKDASIMDTLARVYFNKGDIAKAVKVQTEAVSIADDMMKPSLEESLQEYKDAMSHL